MAVLNQRQPERVKRINHNAQESFFRFNFFFAARSRFGRG
jgi:hypothetical protein